MPYSRDQAEQMFARIQELREHTDRLTDAYFGLPTRAEASRNYMTYGLLRRLLTLRLCMNRVFELLPPDETEPTRDTQLEATIYLQAFVVNVSGVLDNLARIWCLEIDLREAGDRPIRHGHIGFGPGYHSVRASLPPAITNYLDERSGWFDYLKSYRDALAHRIPLYIPPNVLRPDDEADFNRLEQEKREAHQRRDFGRWHSALRQQRRLGAFEPLMAHSIGPDELDAPPYRFHAQMISDFGALLDIGDLVHVELLRRRGAERPQN